MEKPRRPKKPQQPQIQPPREEVAEHFYPREYYYDINSSARRLKFIPGSEFPTDLYGDGSQETQDWYDNHSSVSSLTLQQLVSYATEKLIPLDKIVVGAVIPHREADYTDMELIVTRQRSREELAALQQEYDQAMAAHQTRLATYEQAKIDYPRLKAEWDLHQAQQALNHLNTNTQET